MYRYQDRESIQRIWPGYVVDNILGKGGFGQVYKIHRDILGNRVYSAVKVIHIPADEFQTDELIAQGMTYASVKQYYREQAYKFLNENTMMEKLKSAANIVTIEECKFEKSENDDQFTIYIRMELLENLNHLMKNYKLIQEDVYNLGRDICDALIACEQMNIVHRDIKPANVFINSFGTYKLGDFGIAREINHTRTSMTQIGTAMYMAPELYSNSKADNKVDIYSLGIMLYRIANDGCFPFVDPANVNPAANQDALVKRLSGVPLPLPSSVDETLGQIIVKACNHDPNQRYQNAQEFKNALLSWKFQQKNNSVEIVDIKETVKDRGEKVEAAPLEKKSNSGKLVLAVIIVFAIMEAVLIISMKYGTLSHSPNKRNAQDYEQDTSPAESITTEFEDLYEENTSIEDEFEVYDEDSDPQHLPSEGMLGTVCGHQIKAGENDFDETFGAAGFIMYDEMYDDDPENTVNMYCEYKPYLTGFLNLYRDYETSVEQISKQGFADYSLDLDSPSSYFDDLDEDYDIYDDLPDIEWKGGITFGSTLNEVKSVYGQRPDFSHNHYTYTFEDAIIHFYFDSEKRLNKVSVITTNHDD